MAEYYRFAGSYESLNNIDKIYVISPDKTPERYERMEKILNKLNLPVEYVRLKAIDGRKAKLVSKSTGKVFIVEDLKNNISQFDDDFKLICANDFAGI